jgi:hypothetical protein
MRENIRCRLGLCNCGEKVVSKSKKTRRHGRAGRESHRTAMVHREKKRGSGKGKLLRDDIEGKR